MAKELTAARVRELLDYDPVTGALNWKNPTDRQPSEGGKAGSLGRAGSKRQYRRFLQIDYKQYPAHRVAWMHANGDIAPAIYIVPKNEDYDDLRLDNLHIISRSEAARRGGPRRGNTSGYRGVTWAKDKERWLAYITHNYKRTFVGYFKTIEEAIAARDNAASNLGLLPVLDGHELEKKAKATTKDARLRVFWRRVQKQTGGLTNWTSFEHFAKEIGELPDANGVKLVLVPVRPDETIGPGNFQWKFQSGKWDYSSKDGKKAYSQFHRAENRNSYRNKNFQKVYGISFSDYEAMLSDQGDVCACCGSVETEMLYGKPKILAVDHCHSTGEIRGLLCGRCNKGIGHFKDDPALLRAAADYIERHLAKQNSPCVASDGMINGGLDAL